ncbi:patatin-like phospholipase family protein [Methylorubrum thiocyanatum]|uniref:patatin-like phospholipase family protein n=1 Tax=Methylorubrum thiocyanatum TaxID=47958 RepID=UPI00383B275F
MDRSAPEQVARTDRPDAPHDDAHNPATVVPAPIADSTRIGSGFRGLAGPRAEKAVSLALQGGGSHGAFTWGVLDALIEDGRVGFEAVTGASAGAMNAVVLVDGWLAGGPDGARAALETFWREASLDADLKPVQQSWIDGVFHFWKGNPFVEAWLKALNPGPYTANPLNINPLRGALERTVDFERLRRADTANVFVSATNVWTGKLAVFDREHLTADHLMASACLPTVFQAVEIDGVPYWDGGYLGNPALYPLHGASTRDVLLVQINPVERRETPRSARDIQDRLNEITFNANLMRELRAIDFVHGLIEEGGQAVPGLERVFLHRIDGTDLLDDYAASSRIDARWRIIERLRDKGRAAAKAWLEEGYADVGVRCTLDLKKAYQ